MVQVVREKRWHEIQRILETLNEHDHVKTVRMFVTKLPESGFHY